MQQENNNKKSIDFKMVNFNYFIPFTEKQLTAKYF